MDSMVSCFFKIDADTLDEDQLTKYYSRMMWYMKKMNMITEK